MTTIGTLLYYGEQITDFSANTLSKFIAATTTAQIKGVNNIPELQSAPQQIDVTSIEDYEEQSEPGLVTGSSLNIVMNYKEGVYTSVQEMNPNIANATEGDLSNFQQCLNLSNDVVRGFIIKLRNGRWFAFNAKAVTTIGAVASAAVVPFTLSLYKRSGVYSGYSKADASQTPQNYYSLRSAGIMDASNPVAVTTETIPMEAATTQTVEMTAEEVTSKV